ncbi:thiamine pyrophosphate-dependent dehydrogenase E1 component subunit alpha [bacterium]|nr:thiamine pyrophosphate-dependent dehydrogenase E1 component subunit alpha [bacterium]
MISEICGTLIKKEQIKGISETRIKSMYERMVLLRLVEEKVADLVSQKRVFCPCHLYEGQEAVAVGVCESLVKEDYVFSTHRSHGHYLAKGGDLKAMIAELFGRGTGCSKGRGGSMHLVATDIGFPGSSAIVAGTIPISVGAALSFSIRCKRNVSVAFFGDGAANEGVFYESLNFASLRKLPVIFICENNFYTTHMPVSAMHADTDLFRKAGVFNIYSIRIDGNNVLEVFKTAKEAIERARNGDGPALIECLTYRWRGHVGPNYDIDKGLREKAELEWWMKNCPVKRIERLLVEEGILSASEIGHTKERIMDEIEEAVSFAERSPFPER